VTATAGADYTATSGFVTFPANSTATQSVSVTITNDLVDEITNGETFELRLANASSGTIADATGIGTITDDDTAQITISDVTVSESAGTATFVVTKSLVSDVDVTVNFATANVTATAGADFTATSGFVTFPANSAATQSIAVTITDDTTAEPTETFEVQLSNASSGTITDATGIGTITDDDP